MKAKKVYTYPPVIEALCEIMFAGSQWDSTIPGLFFEKIKDTYPKKKELDTIEAEVTLSKDVQGSRFANVGKRMQFVREDGSQMVQVEKDLLVVNQLRPYQSFEQWKQVVDSMLPLYIDLTHPTGIKKVGVRYINKIVIPADRYRMEDYFSLYPQVPEHLARSHGKFLMRLEIPPTHKGHGLVITFASVHSDVSTTSAAMLDLYDIIPATQSMPVGEIDRCISEAHENIGDAFEHIITDKTRALFEQEA